MVQRVMLALRMGETPQLAELVNLTARAYAADGAADAASAQSKRRKLADIGKYEVLQAMRENDWYIQGAAQTLGVSRPSMYKLLESHPAIRPATEIPTADIIEAWSASGNDIEDCAARLQTPAEALRRHLRILRLSN